MAEPKSDHIKETAKPGQEKQPEGLGQAAWTKEHHDASPTALEKKIMTTHPSKAAKMIADVVQDGKLIYSNGDVIIDPKSLVPMKDARVNPPADGERSFATQILNNALVNDILQRYQPPIFYKEIRETNGKPLHDGDSGERVLDAKGRKITHDPGLSDSELADELERVTGETRGIIVNSEQVDRKHADDRLVVISKPEDLINVLTQMKAQHRLPAIISVNANWPLFHDVDKPKPGYGGHFIVITEFHEGLQENDEPTVEISNNWGRSFDLTVPVFELYKATRDIPDPNAKPHQKGRYE